MLPVPESAMTRSHFLESTTVAAGVACFAARRVFAIEENSVEAIRASAASSKVTVQKLRDNVSVLIGAETLPFCRAETPSIDYSTGGSDRQTVVIPRHGRVGGKAELTLFRDLLVEVRDKVTALKKEGRSPPEFVAVKPGARFDPQ